MADPFSIAAASVGLVLQCAKIVKTLYGIADSFSDARLTVLSAIQELDIIQLAWEKIEQLLKTWESSREMEEELLQRLSRQLEFGRTVMTALSDDLPVLTKKSYSLTQTTRIVWNQDLFRAHQDRIRGQAAAMTLLLSVLQMPSVNERTEGLNKGVDILRESDESSLSIVPSRLSSHLPSYIADSRRQSAESSELFYQELSIDNELFTARVYKRNYRNGTMSFNGRPQRHKSPTTSYNQVKQPGSQDDRYSFVGHSVWAARVDFLTPADTSSMKTVEGPSADKLHFAGDHQYISKSTTYPSIISSVAMCSPKSLDGLLRSTKRQYQEWKLCYLYEACKQGKSSLVKTLLDHQVWLDGHVAKGNAALLGQTTPLHLATSSSSPETVKVLLQKGGRVKATIEQDTEDGNGFRPLHYACQQSSLEAIALLVEAGASIRCRERLQNRQPLHFASFTTGSDPSIIHYLLEKGADIKAKTSEGLTPIHLACMVNNLAILNYLLSRSPSLEAESNGTLGPLHVACRYGNIKLIETLLRAGFPVDSKTADGRTPLYVACIRGVLSIVEELTKERNKSHGVETWSESPLVVAVCGLNYPIVSRLIQRGSNVNFARKRTGQTILQQAVSEQCVDTISKYHRRKTIEVLLDYGADAAAQDSFGHNVLHHWALTGVVPPRTGLSEYWLPLEENRCRSLLHSLIEAGADVDAQNLYKETPLFLAKQRGVAYLVEALEETGARQHCTTEGPLLSVNFRNYNFNLDSDYKSVYEWPRAESFTAYKAGRIEPPIAPQLCYSRYYCQKFGKRQSVA